MNEHPIENLMNTAMNSIRDMVDANTIIGERIISDGITIIPISKVNFGFAAGGSEFKTETMNEYTKKDKDEQIQYRLPFGGGSGAGVSISPVAFLIVQNENIKLMPVTHSSCVDKLLDYVPDLVNKLNDALNKSLDNKKIKKEEKKIEKQIENETKKIEDEIIKNDNNESISIKTQITPEESTSSITKTKVKPVKPVSRHLEENSKMFDDYDFEYEDDENTEE